jgi:glycosyltransferase involved in cell wall biosynthesis
MELGHKTKRLTVLWLCRLNLDTYKDHFKIKAHKGHPVPWITYLFEEIKKRDLFDLHIITTSSFTNRNIYFRDNNIRFNIISRKIPFYYLPTRIFRYFPFLKRISDFFYVMKGRKIINQINPDLINLHGTENEDVLPLLREVAYPVIITIQGLFNLGINYKDTPQRRKKLNIENRILQMYKYYIIRNEMMKNIIIKYRQDAEFYYHHYPMNSLALELYNKDINKDAHITFAGAIVHNKGIEDLISALVIVKKEIPNVTLKIIGFGNSQYTEFIKEKILQNNLTTNISFLGFLTNEEVIKEIKKSKIYVLPTYYDTCPGTVAESMCVGTPVISNNVDGLPYMIENNKSGLLVAKGDVKQLACAIIKLLLDPIKRDSIRKSAFKFAEKSFKVTNIVNELNDIYIKILEQEIGKSK